MSMHIVDDEQRRDRPQPPCALRVPAARGHLLCWCSSTMCTDIACVALPRIYPRGARNATPPSPRIGSSACAGVLVQSVDQADRAQRSQGGWIRRRSRELVRNAGSPQFYVEHEI